MRGRERHREFRRQSLAAVPLAHRPRGQEQGNAQLGTEKQALSAAAPTPANPLPPPPFARSHLHNTSLWSCYQSRTTLFKQNMKLHSKDTKYSHIFLSMGTDLVLVLLTHPEKEPVLSGAVFRPAGLCKARKR